MDTSVNKKEIEEIRRANPWLDGFDLSDKQLDEIANLIADVILNKMDLSEFYEKVKNIDKDNARNIALTAVENRFLDFNDYIKGLEKFTKSLGKNIIADESKNENDASNKADFNFSMEDEREIEQIKSKMSAPLEDDFQEIIKTIILEYGFQPQSEVMKKRLFKIIEMRLKDVRDELETEEVLRKNKKIGGLEFSRLQAETLIKIIRKKRKQYIESDKPFLGAKVPLAKKTKQIKKRKLDDLKKRADKKIDNTNKNKEAVNISKEKDEAKPANERRGFKPEFDEEDGLPVVKLPQEDDLMVKPRIIKPTEKPAVKKNLNRKEIDPQPRPSLVKNETPVKPPKKNQVSDVKFVKKTHSPIDELLNMTLIDFRRLGDTAEQATDEIKEKINLLEKDSYAEKIKGIDAWHKSEVGAFYRRLGRLSMEQGKGVEDIIEERVKNNKPTLSLDEFYKIMELNDYLRY